MPSISQPTFRKIFNVLNFGNFELVPSTALLPRITLFGVKTAHILDILFLQKNANKKYFLKVAPKLLLVLESGCHKGQVNPVHIYPNVLPLANQIAQKLASGAADDDTDVRLASFFSKLLGSIQRGLQVSILRFLIRP
jgi:hypothetical protein